MSGKWAAASAIGPYLFICARSRAKCVPLAI